MAGEENLDVQIVEYLLTCSWRSVPQISKALKAADSTVDYHVKKLVEQGILEEHVPKGSTFRKYGRKYRINSKIKTGKGWIKASAMLALTLAGIILAPSNPTLSVVMLAAPATAGLYFTLKSVRQSLNEKAKQILAMRK